MSKLHGTKPLLIITAVVNSNHSTMERHLPRSQGPSATL